jgi:hypothetical protein
VLAPEFLRVAHRLLIGLAVAFGIDEGVLLPRAGNFVELPLGHLGSLPDFRNSEAILFLSEPVLLRQWCPYAVTED